MTRFDRTQAKTAKARVLRAGQTDCERIVWSQLRSAQIEGASFRRQHPIGPYVLDIYCPSLKIAVELDGGQHGDSIAAAKDQRRDLWLSGRGILTLRFWNSDVTENLDGVMEVIRSTILDRRSQRPTPSQPPPFRGRGRNATAETSSPETATAAQTPPPERGRAGGGQRRPTKYRPDFTP